jgi:cellulose synthase/poly-beta-1,6-N-acetylglucosamine synthase-like glycosyltransferase
VTPSVSVVVPALDAEGTVAACIESLLALDYPQPLLELVVVDNGSRDATCRVVAAHGRRVRLLHEPVRGPAAARNSGIRGSEGEVVAFTDADCVVDPRWLSELVAALAEPEVGIAGGAIRALPPACPAELYGERIHDQHRSILVWRPPYVITMNWASPRAVLEQVGRFDPRLLRCEDVDLSYRIGAAGYRLVFAPAALVYHRNERSLAGLFREGAQHGFYAVPVVRRHADLIAAARAAGRPPDPPRDAPPARYDVAFRSGKRLGRAAGRLRRRT